jgi:hypothetical protein
MATTFKFGGGNWAVKDGYALAYNDENNNFKPLPFDFTRASSATRVNKQGLIETVPSGKPRIDFLDNTSGHLLLEPSRTNLATYSEDIQQNFSTTDMTDTFEYGTAPNGLQKSTRLQLSNVGASRYVYTLTGIVSSGTTYNFSCYYKGIQGQTAYMYALPVGGTDVEKQITFTGDWQRVDITFTAGSSSNYVYIVDSRRGGNASDFEVWGTQVEAGSYATSYIPTEGSSVTRVAETSEINSVPNVPTSYPFVMYVEGNHTLGQESGVCGFYDKSNQFQYYSILFSSNNKVLAISRQPGTENTLTSTSTYTDGFHKIAVLFLNDTTIKLYVDGELDSTKTDCSNNSFNTAFTDYVIGVFRSNSTNSCNIKDFRIFNHELTDTELKNLTS